MSILGSRSALAIVPFFLVALIVALVQPVYAQLALYGTAYYATTDYILNSDVSGYDVFVGKDPISFATLPGTTTLFVANGAKITQSVGNQVYPDGMKYSGLNVFGNHHANITGGSISYAAGSDTSTVNISGGSISYAVGSGTSTVDISGGSISYAYSLNTSTVNIHGGYISGAIGSDTSIVNISSGNVSQSASYGISTVNISGGSIYGATGFNTSTVNIRGGSLDHAYGFASSTVNISGGSLDQAAVSDTSTINISGGSLSRANGSGTSIVNIRGGAVTQGIFLYDSTASTNFIGRDFSFTYNGYGNSNPFKDYADFFTISGTFNGSLASYDLYLRNPAGATGSSNGTQRQFNFVTVPEPGSFALVLPALCITALGWTRCKRNAPE